MDTELTNPERERYTALIKECGKTITTLSKLLEESNVDESDETLFKDPIVDTLASNLAELVAHVELITSNDSALLMPTRSRLAGQRARLHKNKTYMHEPATSL